MRRSHFAHVCVVTAALTVCAFPLLAQSPGGARSQSKETPADAVPPADPRDLSGMWSARGRLPGTPAVIKPEFQAQYGGAERRGGGPPGPGAQNQAGNSDTSQLCIPSAFFGAGAGYPTLIIQTAGQLTTINEENHRTHMIYIGREFPKPLQPTYSGYGVAHWEGDTLVAETRAIKPRRGTSQLPDYRVVERFRKTDGGRVLEWTVEAYSSVYQQPAISITTHNWRPDLRIQEEICEEFSTHYKEGYYQ